MWASSSNPNTRKAIFHDVFEGDYEELFDKMLENVTFQEMRGFIMLVLLNRGKFLYSDENAIFEHFAMQFLNEKKFEHFIEFMKCCDHLNIEIMFRENQVLLHEKIFACCCRDFDLFVENIEAIDRWTQNVEEIQFVKTNLLHSLFHVYMKHRLSFVVVLTIFRKIDESVEGKKFMQRCVDDAPELQYEIDEMRK